MTCCGGVGSSSECWVVAGWDGLSLRVIAGHLVLVRKLLVGGGGRGAD